MNTTNLVTGIDEVGRGALAGPVVVGAVQAPIFDLRKQLEAQIGRELSDSKRLSIRQRELLVPLIQQGAIWAIGEATAREVDEQGIVTATAVAAGRALEQLAPSPILADAGLHHPFEAERETQWLVRGDEQVFEIMLASIIAKVYRDQLMKELAAQLPGYGWEKNVGYGTSLHYQGIQDLGLTVHHRRSFCTGY